MENKNNPFLPTFDTEYVFGENAEATSIPCAEGVFLTNFGKFLACLRSEQSPVASITRENMVLFGVDKEVASNILATFISLYDATCTLMAVRQFRAGCANKSAEETAEEVAKRLSAVDTLRKQGKWTSRFEELSLEDAEHAVSIMCRSLFRYMGERAPRNGRGGKNRPFASITTADFAIIGEVIGEAVKHTDNQKLRYKYFTDKFGAMLGAMALGAPFMLISEKDMSLSLAEANRLKAEKAKVTRENNEKKKAEAEKEKAETNKKLVEAEEKLAEANKKIDSMMKNAIDVGKAIYLVSLIEGNEDIKQQLMAVLTNQPLQEKAAPAKEKAAPAKA